VIVPAFHVGRKGLARLGPSPLMSQAQPAGPTHHRPPGDAPGPSPGGARRPRRPGGLNSAAKRSLDTGARAGPCICCGRQLSRCRNFHEPHARPTRTASAALALLRCRSREFRRRGSPVCLWVSWRGWLSGLAPDAALAHRQCAGRRWTALLQSRPPRRMVEPARSCSLLCCRAGCHDLAIRGASMPRWQGPSA
jgi:hypothetical protein